MDDPFITDYLIKVFLEDCGWHKARRQKIAADWSSRYYIRLTDGLNRAILLVSPPDDSPASVAGHKLGDLIRINAHLNGLGLSVPRIMGMDEAQGLVLMEDFGTTTLDRAARSGSDEQTAIYEDATRVLCVLRDHPDALTGIKLIDYTDGHVYRALRFLPEFYLPSLMERERTQTDLNAAADTDAYLSLWADVMLALPPCLPCLTHIDFFAENLMLLNDRKGLNRIGILDYQGAVRGPFVYDLVNLLEDARRNIPDALKLRCKALYTEALDTQAKQAFDVWYPVIAAQFHARVLGQIVKLSVVNGRDDLLKHRARLEAYLSHELASTPALSEIRRFLAEKGAVFAKETLSKSA